MTRKRRLLKLGRIAATGAAKRLVRGADGDEALGALLAGELDQMKGMAMKIGQILSYLDTPLPAELVASLQRLQAGVTGVPWPVAAAVIEGELGAPAEDLFDRIDEEPVAAASIGQVHRAWLDEAPVAVKVRYPDVADSFDEDLARLGGLAKLASLAGPVDGEAIVAELGARLREECDYAAEARWQELFAAAVAALPDLSVPAVVAPRSAAAVLTTRWADGVRFDAFAAAASPAARLRAARALGSFAWHGLLAWEVAHADPHPGNFLFTEDGAVVVLDFGCVKVFEPAFVDAWRRSLRCVVHGDDGFEQATRDAGMVGGRGFDFGEHRAMLEWLVRPYVQPSFRFTAAYNAEAQRFGQPTSRHTRSMAVPAPWIWFARTTFGLHAVLARLGAEGDFRGVLQAPLAAGPQRLTPT